MADQPLVSILTPTYQHAAFIGACIESVLAQSESDWEMLILDDGSTDGTAEIVKGYSDPRIKYLPQPNKGIAKLGETYNAGLQQAKGELIAILEGDDFWPPNKLSTQILDFRDPIVAVSSGCTLVVDVDGKETGLTIDYDLPEDALLNRPVGRTALRLMDPRSLTFTFPVSTMIRRSALESIGGFLQPNGLPLVDFPTILALTLVGEFRWHKSPMGYWRRHGDSTTKSRLGDILERVYQCIGEWIPLHRDQLPASDAELRELQRLWEQHQADFCTKRGRLFASERDWILAHRAFAEAGLYQMTKKLAAANMACRLCARLHCPVEWIFKAIRRPGLEASITSAAGDRLVSRSDMDRERPIARWI